MVTYRGADRFSISLTPGRVSYLAGWAVGLGSTVILVFGTHLADRRKIMAQWVTRQRTACSSSFIAAPPTQGACSLMS